MKDAGSTLVVGATGLLGSEIVRLLLNTQTSIRAVVREGNNSNRVSTLRRQGVETVTADLKDSASLAIACRGVRSVISTATAVASLQDGDSIETVDELGQLALIEAAEMAGVDRFVFISFPPTELDFALQRAKRKIEARLHASRMSYSVFQAVDFAEVWLSPIVGFDLANGKVTIFGDGNHPVSWVSVRDVARFAVAALESECFRNRVVQVGGPDPLSPLQVIEIFRQLGGTEVVVGYVSESDLHVRLESATNWREEAFAATMLSTAKGQVVDVNLALELLPGRLVTVRDYINHLMEKSN